MFLTERHIIRSIDEQAFQHLLNGMLCLATKRVNVLLMSLLLICSLNSFSQQEKKYIRDGNQQYEKKDYIGAEKNYIQGLNKNRDSYKSAFNLGDAYYQQGKYEEAAEQFQQLTHRATSRDTLSKSYHNLGNSLLKAKKYEESVNAYKNALKNNPNDEDSRYNLAYAQQMLKQQQQQQNKDNKDNKDKDNKDKDNKNKDSKDKDNKDKDKKDNKDDKQKKDQEKQKKDQEKPQISKEDAKRLLDALQNDEKNLQDKMKKEKGKGMKVQIEKDW